MLIQSTVTPLPRLCVLLGGPRERAPMAEPRRAALFSPRPRSHLEGPTP